MKPNAPDTKIVMVPAAEAKAYVENLVRIHQSKTKKS